MSVDTFHKNGWCKIKQPELDLALEDLIDEILDFSHFIYEENVPRLDDKTLKSDYLSASLARFAKVDRKRMSFVYDGIKNLGTFHSFYANQHLLIACNQILNSQKLITIKDSVGIRIDLPEENNQLTEVHQEFHSFPYSLSGLVVWVPLTTVNLDNGSIKLYENSHKTIFKYNGDYDEINSLIEKGKLQEAQKVGGLVLPSNLDEPMILDASIGDIFIMSVGTLHESVAGQTKDLARVTCQLRVFDYCNDFFLWKSQNYRFNEGLKQPIISQKLYEEFNG